MSIVAKAIVIGSNHHNTLGVVQSLGIARVPVYVIILGNVKSSFVLASKYVVKGWVCNNEEEMTSCLQTNFSNKENQPIVITCNDIVATFFDSHYDFFRQFLKFPFFGEGNSAAYWMKKDNMRILAESIGLNTPKSQIIKAGSEYNDIQFPCLTKSVSSLEGAKTNLHIFHSDSQLNSFLKNKKTDEEVIVQQYIDKDFEFQFIGVSLNGGDLIFIPGRTHIVRPNGIDNTFFLRYLKIDKSMEHTLHLTKQFIKETCYSGLFSVEFLRDKNGKDYFLEMNFRNDGNAKCVTKAGFNLPYIWYMFNTGGNYKQAIDNSSFEEVTFVPEEEYYLLKNPVIRTLYKQPAN